MDLIKGKDPHPPRQDERPSQSQDSPAVFTPTHGGNSEMEDQNHGIQVATGTACTTSQPVPISASDTLRNYDEELANFRSEVEQRLAEEDPEGCIHEAQEKTYEIHHHAVLAQQLFKQGQEHADTAVKVAESLLETLTTAKRHFVAVPDDGERPSKRLREN
ncbi:hypothetical protein FAGAP_4563 [Fusarium agapanthi]|uniref:Uncharacterized protein n=1 Tax=Fusarium agapanthi TaxID=1803897 RepID=A0A9P5BB73_9HYPO|nr:hypothetical protein FAGAP_4563 [Fusarium agapanthi]